MTWFQYGKLEYFQRVLQSEIPMKRLGQPEEVAGPAAFILSDDASYITGETIIVSGGVTTRHWSVHKNFLLSKKKPKEKIKFYCVDKVSLEYNSL